MVDIIIVSNQLGVRSRLVEVFVNTYKRLSEHEHNYVTFRTTGSSFVSLFSMLYSFSLFVLKEGFGWLLNI